MFPADPSRAFRNLNILFTLFIGLVLLVFFHKKPLARVIQSKGFAVFLLGLRRLRGLYGGAGV